MSCNSESRRAINYSLQEPINNKYDLWLSENLRYNSEGSLIYDSPGQPACDLILKIYKDGDWKPIAGLSTEHIVANKINIVDGVNYTYISPNDNVLHINNGFQLNHLPLFRNPQDSPNELFDAGTLGEAIYGFVTETEWKNIFEGDSFSEAFELYIQEGDTNINLLINPAESDKLGGIYADEFSIEDMFPDIEENHNHTSSQINDSYNWIALAKYKLNHGTFDYNLYVSAKDIIGAINNYHIYNPEAPGIDIDINSLIQELKNIFKNSSSLGFEDVWGVASDPHVYPHIWGVTPLNAGCFLRINPEWNDEGEGWSQSNNNMDWVDLNDIYPLLGLDSSLDVRYVVKGGGKAGQYLDYEGEWTEPFGGLHADHPIYVNSNNHHIYIRPYLGQDNRTMYIGSHNGTVDWMPVNSESPIRYTGTSPISVDNINNTISITGSDDSNDVLCSDGSGGVEWRNIQSVEEYEAGDGIEISSNTISQNIKQNSDIITITPASITISAGSNNNIEISLTDSYSISETLNAEIYEYIDLSNYTGAGYIFTSIPTLTNPIYLKIHPKSYDTNVSVEPGILYIGDYTSMTLTNPCLVTIQFGIIKFEEILEVPSVP